MKNDRIHRSLPVMRITFIMSKAVGTISVAIVEDSSDLRDGLVQLIQATPGFALAGAFASCEHFIRHIKTTAPRPSAVTLMDIGLPGMSGIEGVQIIKTLLPSTDILMFTVFEDDQKIFDSLCAGASGYILKKTPPSKLLEAIRETHEGGSPMSATIARKVLAQFQSFSKPATPDYGLTEREHDVLAGLVKGMSYKMIADCYAISLDTVRSHIRHIYDKLHINSKGQAISLALKKHLL
jgi:DNA-binding NarL/FixJ family response regulator